MSNQQKKNTFYGAAAILTVSTILVKIIGAIFKIPLIAILPEEAYGDFNGAYNIYSFFLTISTAGLPVALSKTVSECHTLGRENQKHRVFRVAFCAFLFMGLFSFLCMSVFGQLVATYIIGNEKAVFCVWALAPAVLCTCCCSAFRGYAQGHGNMTPTAVSQIIEALCKLVVGLGLAYWRVKHGADASHAAAGAITGVTVGTIVALAYMLLNYLMGRSREGLAKDTPDSNATIIRNLLMIAVPITISSSMVGIVTVIDSSLVQGQLQRALLENTDCWALYKDFMNFDTLESALKAWQATLPEGTAVSMSLLSDQLADGSKTAGALHDALEAASRTLYGNYNGALNIYNLPTSLMAAITASVIPAVSAALARRDRRGAARITGSALRITALLSFPMGVGLFVLGTPIIRLLFPSLNVEVAGPLLSTLGIATPFVCMVLVCNSVLQAHGFINLPVIVMVLGGIVKIVNNYNLVGAIGIAGAPVGNILCFGLALVLDLVVITRVIPNRPRLLPIFVKPAIASAIMGGAAWAVYGLLSRVLTAEQVNEAGQTIRVVSRMGNALGIFLAIAVAGVVYLVLVVAIRAISKDDLALMPKGDKLARLLRL